MERNKIYQGDCLELLRLIPDNSIDSCITSPPYYGLRDYGMNGQLGLEETPESFVQKLVDVFREVRRVLKPTGTCWINIGDSYAQVAKTRTSEQAIRKSNLKGSKDNQIACKDQINKITGNLKQKDLIGVPWMLAFALRNDGWYLRQDIIWSKPNPMPESVTDRCTKSHEYIFLLTKSSQYYFDHNAIKTQIKDSSVQRLSQDIENQNGSNRVPFKTNGPMKAVIPGRIPRKGVDNKGGNQGSKEGIPSMAIHGRGVKGHSGNFDQEGNLIGDGMANKRSVWNVATKPFKEAHFATFPEELIVDMIKSGSSITGCCSNCGSPFDNPPCNCQASIIPSVILDPFMGAGTTALVSRKLD